MKKPYIKKYCEIAGFKVFVVDGKFIRTNIDEEFTNFGSHYTFDFIPEKELWLDKSSSPGEEKFFINNMLAFLKKIKSRASYSEAIDYGDEIEKKERFKSKFIKEITKTKEHSESILESIRKKLIKEYSSEKLKVYIVNGELVRSLFFIDFTEGGHDLVYPFVPKGEVWLDDDVSAKERKYVLLHEIHERNLMAKGWPYDVNDTRHLINNTSKKFKKSAHFSASHIELLCRHGKKNINTELKREVKIAKRLK